MPVDPESALDHLRRICSHLPEVTERPSHGSPTFFVRDRKTVVSFGHDHHGDGRTAITAPAPPGVQEEVIDTDPIRFFRPPYVGHLGWIGYRLDIDDPPDWDEVEAIIHDAFRRVAPRTLVAELDRRLA